MRLKIKPEGLRRFWSVFPLTRVPFWYRFFEPQPNGFVIPLVPCLRKLTAAGLGHLAGAHAPGAHPAEVVFRWSGWAQSGDELATPKMVQTPPTQEVRKAEVWQTPPVIQFGRPWCLMLTSSLFRGPGPQKWRSSFLGGWLTIFM